MKILFILSVLIITCKLSNAQQTQTNEGGAVPVAQNAPAPMTAADSLNLAIANAKTAFNDIRKLFAKKSDTMLIVIPQIEYDNSSLAQLKESLKKVKGVRSVTSHYTTATATLEIAYKGQPTDLWDLLPADIKAPFKVTELGATNITLLCKQNPRIVQ